MLLRTNNRTKRRKENPTFLCRPQNYAMNIARMKLIWYFILAVFLFFCTHFLCVRFINTSARRCAYKSCKIYTEQLHTHTHINTHIVRDICASCYFAGHCLRFDNIHSHRHTHTHWRRLAHKCVVITATKFAHTMGHCVWLWQAKRKPAREVFGIGVERVERHWCAMLTTHTPPPPPPPTIPIRFTHIHTQTHTCLSLSLINAAQASATLAVKTIFRLAFQAFYGFISTKISPLNTQIVACQRRACFIHRTEQNRTEQTIA